MSPARLAFQIWNSRRPLWPAATDEERFTAGYLAGRAAATARLEPDRRIPRECGCISGHCTQEPSWSAGVRCKERLQEGFELMGETS